MDVQEKVPSEPAIAPRATSNPDPPFARGSLVELHTPGGPWISQIVELCPPMALIKHWPLIDYDGMKKAHSTLQSYVSGKAPRDYVPPEAPFRPDGLGAEKKTLKIWDKERDCLFWDGKTFIGEFQYERVPLDQLSMPKNVPQPMLNRFSKGMANFEAELLSFKTKAWSSTTEGTGHRQELSGGGKPNNIKSLHEPPPVQKALPPTSGTWAANPCAYNRPRIINVESAPSHVIDAESTDSCDEDALKNYWELMKAFEDPPTLTLRPPPEKKTPEAEVTHLKSKKEHRRPLTKVPLGDPSIVKTAEHIPIPHRARLLPVQRKSIPVSTDDERMDVDADSGD
jgi:hypothetical protein